MVTYLEAIVHPDNIWVIECQQEIPLPEHMPLLVHLAGLENADRLDRHLLVRSLVECQVDLPESSLTNILHHLIVLDPRRRLFLASPSSFALGLLERGSCIGARRGGRIIRLV